MLVYYYHSITKEYVSSGYAQVNPRSIGDTIDPSLLPANSTTVAPPAFDRNKFSCRFTGVLWLLESLTAVDSAYQHSQTVGNPHRTRHDTLPDVLPVDVASSDATYDKHVSNALGKTWSDHLALTEAHGATGAVVGTTNTQTLINKTLSSPDTLSTLTVGNTGLGLNCKVDQSYSGTGTAGSPVPTVGVLVGADEGANTRTNATRKTSRLGSAHYTNAEEPVSGLFIDSLSTTSVMHVGGGDSKMNAATALIFYTAANSTTTTGTERVRISSTGDVQIGSSTASPTAEKLQVYGAGKFGSTARTFHISKTSGSVVHKNATGDAAWANNYGFEGFTAATLLGAFGAYGAAKDTIARMWIGLSHTDTKFTVDMVTGNTLMGAYTDLGTGEKLQVTGKIRATDLIICNGKVGLTPTGGVAVRLTNRTGAASVKGTVVCASSAYDNAVNLIVVDIPDPIGVIYEDGIADGQEVWVVKSGIAEVYFIGSTTRKHFARGFISTDSGYVSGQALSEAVPTSPFATDKHFYEIGHVLESRTGAGLAKTELHFN